VTSGGACFLQETTKTQKKKELYTKNLDTDMK
jgi:hypothetical protein